MWFFSKCSWTSSMYIFTSYLSSSVRPRADTDAFTVWNFSIWRFKRKCLNYVPMLNYLLLSENGTKFKSICSFFDMVAPMRISALRLCLLFNLKSLYAVWQTETIQPVNVLGECWVSTFQSVVEMSSSTAPSVVVASVCRLHIQNKPFILPFQPSRSTNSFSNDNWQAERLNTSYYPVRGWHLLGQFIHWTLKYVVIALIKKHLSLVVALWNNQAPSFWHLTL